MGRTSAVRGRLALAAIAVAVLALAAPATAAARPDLVVTSVPNPPSRATPGAVYEQQDSVKNVGTARAGASKLGFYLSVDQRRNAGDVLFGSRDVKALRPGQASRGTTEVTVPDVPDDTYFVLACADDQKRVREAKETNNCRSSATRLEVLPPEERPAAPLITGSTPSSPSQTVTNPTLNGTATPLAHIRIYTNSACAAPEAAGGLADEDGGFSIPVTVSANSTTTFWATAAPTPTEVSSCSLPRTYVHDNLAPDPPTLGGSSPTNDLTPNVTGETDPKASIRLFTNGDCTGDPVAMGEANDAGEYSIEVAVAENGSTSFVGTATDRAGNPSGCSSAFVYVHDGIAPDTPSMDGTIPASPSPRTTPKVFGTTSSDTAQVRIYADVPCTGTPAAVGSASAYNFDGIPVTVSPGTHTFLYAEAVDSAGNTSCNGALSYYALVEEAEPNATPATATPLPLGKLEGGTFSSRMWTTYLRAATDAGDTDYFSVTVPMGGSLAVSAPNLVSGGCGGIPLTVSIRNAMGGLLQQGETGSACAFVGPVENLAAGTYTIAVEYAGSASRYFLAVDVSGPPVELEDNGTPEFATLVPSNRLRTEGALQEDDVDYYAVDIPFDGFSLAADTFDGTGVGCAGVDTRIRLFAPDGTTELLVDDDDGQGDCSRINGGTEEGADAAATDLSAGRYYVSVEEADGEPVPLYQIWLRAFPTVFIEEEEDNNSAPAASFLLAGNPSLARASISPVGDVDFFALDVPVGSSVRVETRDGTAGGCAGGIDTVVELRASNGTTVLQSDDDDGMGSCSLINPATDAGARDLAGGRYYVRVIDFGNNDLIPEYFLTVVVTPPPAESEPNDTSATANPFAGRAISGSLGSGDADYFSFRVDDGFGVVVESFGPDGIDCSPAVNARVTLFAPNGSSELATREGACAGINGSGAGGDAGARNLAGGTYYVRVDSTSGATGSYYLSVRTVLTGTPEVEPNNDVAGADAVGISISGPTVIAGSISSVNAPGPPATVADLDFFKVEVTTPGLFRFETYDEAGDCVGFATVLRLGTALTPLVADSQSGGLRSCSSIAYYLTSGTYYVQVEENGRNALISSYFLRVTTSSDGGAEAESNDTTAGANAVTPGSFIAGSHQISTDTDWYTVVVPEGGTLRAEIVEGSAETCDSSGIDSSLALFAPNGTTQLASDTDDGRGFCSQIDGRGSLPLDTGARNLGAGTYFLRVTSHNTTNVQSNLFDYRLVVDVS